MGDRSKTKRFLQKKSKGMERRQSDKTRSSGRSSKSSLDRSQRSRSGEESNSWATEIPARRRGRERRVEESGESNRHNQIRKFEERIEIADRRTVGEGEVEEKK